MRLTVKDQGEDLERRRRRHRDQEVRHEIQVRIWQAEREIRAAEQVAPWLHAPATLMFTEHLAAVRRLPKYVSLADWMVTLDLLELWEQTHQRKLEWTAAA